MTPPSGSRLHTPRLELVAGTLAISEAELGDRAAFGSRLGAEVGAWPPPLNDEASIRYMRDLLAAHPGDPGWAVWYFLLRRENAPPLAIGNGGFTGPPDAGGNVEIGYSLLEPHQGNGYATEAIGALLGWAFSRPEVRSVSAQTFPELIASVRLLEKLRFQLAGSGSEPGAVRYTLSREHHEKTP